MIIGYAIEPGLGVLMKIGMFLLTVGALFPLAVTLIWKTQPLALLEPSAKFFFAVKFVK